jgi:methyl acetate hydrolase
MDKLNAILKDTHLAGNGTDQGKNLAKLKALFEDAVKTRKVPGVAAIAYDKSGDVIFKGAFGTTNLADGSAAPMKADTQCIMWSCTKVVTCVAALQLIEQGKLSLDDPVEKYVPKIKDIQLIEAWGADGKPVLREPKTKPTILHLVTHTAGFTYDFFDEKTLKWQIYHERTPSTYSSGQLHMFQTPLVHEPGSKHTYGINIDWLGMAIEQISGKSLPDYIKENITEPLGMKHTGPQILDDGNFLIMHHRGADGNLTADPTVRYPKEQEIFGGGHYLYSTLNDFSTFLLTLLNEGTHPKTHIQIIKPETVNDYLFKDIIPESADKSSVGVGPSTLPPVSNTGEMAPNVKKGWSAGLMINLEDLPTGRKAGSGAWAGLGNLFYWIDLKAGKTGLIMGGILPFLDPEILSLFEELERAVYGADPASGEHTHFKVN